ncbi:hypothetical protein RSAG8_02415, partial [Rhizoctonia solani AG-8 WAC10335]
MSTITKLNSPDRSSQKVSTLIDMATIRQHYKREEARTISLPRLFRPTVRFADLTPAAQILTPDCSSTESEDPAESAYNGSVSQGDGQEMTVVGSRHYFEVEHEDGVFVSQGDGQEMTVVGSRHYFEVEHEDGVFLASKMLSEALFDHTNASQKTVRPLESPPHPEPARKRQRVDIDSIVF